MKKEPHIYDQIFKRIFTLSNLAVINLINGLFDTTYPPDSEIIYLNKEFASAKLRKRLADVLLRINGDLYHLEAQMTKDSKIVLRVFEYGFYSALQLSEEAGETLFFPNPIVIYLSHVNQSNISDHIFLDFGEQGRVEYKIRNFFYQDAALADLNRRKLILLIPFQLLKIKSILKDILKTKQISKENITVLKKLLKDDILDSIQINLINQNITPDDAKQMQELVETLYDYICEDYKECGGYDEMKELLPGALVLPNDVYRIRIDELEQQLKTEKAKAEVEKAELERKAEAERAELERKAEAERAELLARIHELEKNVHNNQP